MKRLGSIDHARAGVLASLCGCALLLAACGGGGDNTPVASGGGGSGGGNSAAAASGVAPAADAAVSAAGTSSAAVVATPKAGLPQGKQDTYRFYRLGSSDEAGNATLSGSTLDLDGGQYAGTTLTPGNCTVNAGGLNQCSSVATQPTFTFCGTGSAGTDRVRSRYVLLDPAAQRITDTSVLKNISFSGYENCGADNVGAQPKTAPSSTLSFDAAGNLTLTRFDRDPARVSSAPSFYVNLSNPTVSGGQSARLTLYRSNGRYLIVATSVPTAGVSSADPGTLIAFLQN